MDATKRFWYWQCPADLPQWPVVKKMMRDLKNPHQAFFVYFQMILASLNSSCTISRNLEKTVIGEISLIIGENEVVVKTVIDFLISCNQANLDQESLTLFNIDSRSLTPDAFRKQNRKKELEMEQAENLGKSPEKFQDFPYIKEEQNRTEKSTKAEKPSKKTTILHHSLNVPIGETRYQNLCEDYGVETVDLYIQKAIDYCSSKGKPQYKDFASAAGSYMSRDSIQKIPTNSAQNIEIPAYIRSAYGE